MSKDYSNAKPYWIKPNKYEDEEPDDETFDYCYDNELDLSEVPF